MPASDVGLLRRLGAVVYDTLLLAAILVVATAVLLPLTGGQAIGPESPWQPLYQAYLAAWALLFFAGFWAGKGQTLGMRAWGIAVRDARGRRPGAGRALLRAVTAALSWLVLGLGFLWVLADRDRLAWHDRLSRTLLVRTR